MTTRLFNSSEYIQGKILGQEVLIREDFYNQLMLSIIFGRPNQFSLLIRLLNELNKLNDNGNKPMELKD